jgi:DNA-binding MarR family transcriptional regulator
MIDTDPATMQGIVKRLIERGWIDRRTDKTHKRRMLLRLTEQGRTLVSDTVPKAFTVSRQTMAELSDIEQAELLSLLRKLVGSEEK